MSESKFTPGPWRAEGPDSFLDFNILHDGDSLAVAAVVSNMRNLDEIEANARLIAAAPCLLEALRELVKINVEHNESIAKITGAPTGWKDSYLDDARAAIQRATASPMGKE